MTFHMKINVEMTFVAKNILNIHFWIFKMPHNIFLREILELTEKILKKCFHGTICIVMLGMINYSTTQ